MQPSLKMKPPLDKIRITRAYNEIPAGYPCGSVTNQTLATDSRSRPKMTTRSIIVDETTIDLTFPTVSTSMLIVQPFLEFPAPVQEPFKLIATCASRMLSGIDNVFALSRSAKPNVILFPEFSLPGVQAVEQVYRHLQTSLHPSVVIGGVHGLTRSEYESLCSLSNMNVDRCHHPSELTTTDWVNTSITFIRDDAGRLSMWLQPKISPSWPESNTPHQTMFRGSVIRVFVAKFANGAPCRFFSLLCYDWIGQEHGGTIPEAVLTQVNASCSQSKVQKTVEWAFVLQHNPKPNDHTFLGTAKLFLTQVAYPFVLRQNTAVVMTCTASGLAPMRKGGHGFSSFIFNPVAPFDVTACPPTFSTNAKRLRATDTLGTCKDVVFREMGECVHLANVRNPLFVTPDSTDRTAPLESAEVHALNPPQNDPRVPGHSVSAVVKWVNDELDAIPDLASQYFAGNALDASIRQAHQTTISAYRNLPSQNLAIKVATSTVLTSQGKETTLKDDPAKTADDWNGPERSGINHVIQCLILIQSVRSIEATTTELHGRCVEKGIEVAAICGPTHAACKKTFERFAQRTHSPILLITRDVNNSEHLPRELDSFADPRKGAGVKLADSHTLLSKARTLAAAKYQEYVAELFDVTDRRII